jgi:SAM-dependent methyltransferase
MALMDPDNLPEGDCIYDLYTGVYKPQIVRIALAMDVFTPLAAEAADAEAVARECECDVVGVGRLLDYLVSLNILAKRGDEYSLSPEAATFLVRGRKAYAGDLIMDFTSPAPWDSLAETIRTGQPRSFDLEIHFAQDAWIESYRSARIPSSLEMWAKVGIVPEGSAGLRMLDIACGCAIKSLVLAQKSPKVELTCLDQALVLKAARDLAERLGVTARVRFVADDLLTADLGVTGYDVCLLGQITHYLTGEQNGDLFQRIYRALIPGGRLVLDVPMEAKSQLDENSSFLSLVLWANSGGRAYSFEEYRSWMHAAGFSTVQKHNERLLSAVR